MQLGVDGVIRMVETSSFFVHVFDVEVTVTQGAPSGAGADGDVAIDATTGDIYTYEA